MRLIKFRAWDIEDKRMLQGEELAWVTLATLEDEHDNDFMQYTGLIDNLGTEVYEGDIVAIYPLEQENHAIVEQILFGWCFKQADGTQTTYLSPELFKVIGNIYEGVKE